MSYETDPIPVETPVPFSGTPEEARANFDSHMWVQEDEFNVSCMRCDARVYQFAANYKCGEEPPRTIVYHDFTAKSPFTSES